MIDVQQRTLGSFKHYGFTGRNGLVQQHRSVGHVGRNLGGVAGVLLINFGRIQRLRAEERVRNLIFFIAGIRDVRAKQLRV